MGLVCTAQSNDSYFYYASMQGFVELHRDSGISHNKPANWQFACSCLSMHHLARYTETDQIWEGQGRIITRFPSCDMINTTTTARWVDSDTLHGNIVFATVAMNPINRTSL